MANSRSNIYPVQLQGAELNLNKLDAEIKQYSGFNKNNSPFVGGCLSNIFTKDETIEGATSKNTYIAPNGDVYRVNTEGLWKNDEKLVDTSNEDFFDVVDASFPENTCFVHDENTYLYYKNGSVYFHSENIDRDFMQDSLPPDARNPINDESISYYILEKTLNNRRFVIVAALFKRSVVIGNIPDASGCVCFCIYEKDENGDFVNAFDYYYVNVYLVSPYHVNPVILKTDGNDLNNFKIAVLTNTLANSNFVISFDGQSISLVGSMSIVNASNVTQVWNSYTITQDYFIYTNNNTSNSFYDFKMSYSVDYQNLKVIVNTTATGTSQIASLQYDKFAKFWGCLGVARASGSSAQFVYTIDDDVTTFGYYDVNAAENTQSLFFNLGAILNGQVLINNNEVTGISLPGGNILATEWNTIAGDNFIFFGENTDEWKNNKYVCIWKDSNNKWHKMIKSEPWLKVINNNVIINNNGIKNSYNMNIEKVLLFASAWNNRRPNYKATGNAQSNDVVYMATSINEYALDKNSSLILNPVPVMKINNFPASYSVSNNSYLYEAEPMINIYIGETEVLYAVSMLFLDNKMIINDKLEGLPFPSNTDGNVQYSPSLFATEKGKYGNLVFISEGGTAYKLMTYDNKAVMSYFLTTAIEGLQDFFIIQGQLYGILDNQIYSFSIVNEIANRGDFIVSVEGLQFVGNTPYEALFFSKTNRCLYSFTGANVMNAKQFVDKISEVRNYKYNPATQSIFLITDIGVIVYSLFGIYQIEFLNCQDMYLLNNGVILTDNEGTFKYVKYYKEETTDDYTKENIQLETMFYGMNNQTVTINDCLYMRIFSEEHEEGDLEVSATTLSLEGRMTEKTTFKIKASDWDKVTHTIYLRYQPKEQRGLGISFSINSPFKIASLSIGSQADAILVDKVSKGAINAPQRTSNNVEW
jgi:hypothetical protein